jgi:hypothetical protein
MERLGLTVSASADISTRKTARISLGIPIHTPIFGAKAINLNLEWTSTKLTFYLYKK